MTIYELEVQMKDRTVKMCVQLPNKDCQDPETTISQIFQPGNWKSFSIREAPHQDVWVDIRDNQIQRVDGLLGRQSIFIQNFDLEGVSTEFRTSKGRIKGHLTGRDS